MHLTLALLLATGCRPSEEADVKLVGVGMNPEEIGPTPTAYGGTVEYAHLDFGGAGLPLAFLGLLGYDGVGPQTSSFEPPYGAVMAFSYIFDNRLPAAATLSQVGGAPPNTEDTCYTVIEPTGPIGSFTTVDVGAEMSFFTPDGTAGMTLPRVPADYPPDPQDLFVYYSGFESYRPYGREHLVPDPADPGNPQAMISEVYKPPNYPFGSEVEWSFPGGFSSFDQPVGSIPRPSTASPDGNPVVQVPDELGGVRLEWDGALRDHTGEILSDEGVQSRCFEFYEGRPVEPAEAADCDVLPDLPSAQGEYDAFRGQMYTAPWDTEDGVTFEWTPKEHGDQVTLTVRFLAKVELDDPNLTVASIADDDGDYRDAQECEEADAEFVFDEERFSNSDGSLSAGLHGDPLSKLVEVNCLLADDGEYTLTESAVAEALSFAEERSAGGVVFFFGRASDVDADVPPAKDPYDQRHDISPIKLTAKTLRLGRFWWDQ